MMTQRSPILGGASSPLFSGGRGDFDPKSLCVPLISREKTHENNDETVTIPCFRIFWFTLMNMSSISVLLKIFNKIFEKCSPGKFQ